MSLLDGFSALANIVTAVATAATGTFLFQQYKNTFHPDFTISLDTTARIYPDFNGLNAIHVKCGGRGGNYLWPTKLLVITKTPVTFRKDITQDKFINWFPLTLRNSSQNGFINWYETLYAQGLI